MRTKDLALISVYSALYVVLVIVFEPISFYALQFRIAGILRPGIAKRRELAFGYAIGTLVANIFSPFAGLHELIFMPIMSLISGLIGYNVSIRFNNSYYVCGAIIAVIIPLSVAWMLNQLFNLPIMVTFFGLVISEQIINLIGASIFKLIESRIEWWK
jgi:uncharacterized membrane protein